MPYISELRIFAWGAVPPGWLPCDGRLLQIASAQALYALLGTTYGGDGQTTFALPDLRGRVPIGSAPRVPAGQRSGEEAHTLATTELPGHHHAVQVSAAAGTTTHPNDGVLAAAPVWARPNDTTPMAGGSVGWGGGDQPHLNMQPFLALNVCIATQGIFPAAG